MSCLQLAVVVVVVVGGGGGGVSHLHHGGLRAQQGILPGGGRELTHLPAPFCVLRHACRAVSCLQLAVVVVAVVVVVVGGGGGVSHLYHWGLRAQQGILPGGGRELTHLPAPFCVLRYACRVVSCRVFQQLVVVVVAVVVVVVGGVSHLHLGSLRRARQMHLPGGGR